MQHLGFLNKNMFRKYPLRSSSSMLCTDGTAIPLSLFAGIRIGVMRGFSDMFVSSISVQDKRISVAISSRSPFPYTYTTLGFFSAVVAKDYQNVSLTPAFDHVSGNLTLGVMDALIELQGAHMVDHANGKLEDSTVVCVPVPKVTGILNGSKKAVSTVALNLINISEEKVANFINLDVINKKSILSRNDIDSQRLSCRTNVIEAINSVKPDETGNIDIYGIAPVVITITTEGLDLEGSITTKDLCPQAQVVVPPILFSNLDSYPGIMDATEPEWKTWPDFN